MTRSVSVILAAILYLRPAMPDAQKVAAKVKGVSTRVGIDPLLAVAIFWHESRLRSDAVGGFSGKCLGLGQVCLHIYQGCAVSPLKLDCVAMRTRLLDPVQHVDEFGKLVERNREFCVQKTKDVRVQAWLASYQGYNRPKDNVWCQPGKHTRTVLASWDALVAKKFGP